MPDDPWDRDPEMHTEVRFPVRPAPTNVTPLDLVPFRQLANGLLSVAVALEQRPPLGWRPTDQIWLE